MDIDTENLQFMVVRYNGLNPEVLDYIFDSINTISRIDIKAFYGIKWSESEKKERLTSFYDDIKDEEKMRNILEVNDVVMIGIVLYDHKPNTNPPENVSGKNWNMILLKRRIREKFGNVVHISDSSAHAYKNIVNLIGLNREQVDNLLKKQELCVGEVNTQHSIVKRLNAINNGVEVLWTP